MLLNPNNLKAYIDTQKRRNISTCVMGDKLHVLLF